MAGEDLDILDPQPGVVQFRGERLEVRPLTIGQLPKFVRLARPIINALLDSPLDESSDVALIDVLLDMVDQHGDSAIAAAALVTAKPVAWIEAGDPAEFVALAQTIFRVNRDFFTQKLAPLLGRVWPSASGNGPTPSSSSSSTVTA